MEILWNKIFELRKGTNHPQCNSNFMIKIVGRSNTAHPPTTQYFLSHLALYGSYGRRWNVKNLSCQRKAFLHLICLFLFHTPLGVSIWFLYFTISDWVPRYILRVKSWKTQYEIFFQLDLSLRNLKILLSKWRKDFILQSLNSTWLMS